MNTNMTLGLYLMTAKGVAVLAHLLKTYGPRSIAFIVTSKDSATEYDGHEEIRSLALKAGIPVYSRLEQPLQKPSYLLAVSWRWLIEAADNQLIVFHDSLLPRYRGFSPLVSALVNGEQTIGVTALFASKEYDRGAILSQESIKISYPMTIAEAIRQIIPCYEKLLVTIMTQLLHGKLTSYPQKEAAATYSLWRDEDDYYVNWSWSAAYIKRFVDAVGSPYKGAVITIDGKWLRIRECQALSDVKIENRTPGKVIFVEKGLPVIVCGQGLLKILRLTETTSQTNVLPLGKFRTRIGGKPTTGINFHTISAVNPENTFNETIP